MTIFTYATTKEKRHKAHTVFKEVVENLPHSIPYEISMDAWYLYLKVPPEYDIMALNLAESIASETGEHFSFKIDSPGITPLVKWQAPK